MKMPEWSTTAKRSRISLQSWMSLCGQRKVTTSDWQDMEKSRPTWNTKSPPGHRKFDVPSTREKMARLKIIIVTHFSSVTGFQE